MSARMARNKLRGGPIQGCDFAAEQDAIHGDTADWIVCLRIGTLQSMGRLALWGASHGGEGRRAFPPNEKWR